MSVLSRFHATVALVTLGVVAGGVTSCRGRSRGSMPAPGAATGWNLLLVTLDTTRADRIGCYGDRTASTPVIDALAAGGIRFADAVTVAPVTLPSHATIMTGLYPPGHGVRNNGQFRLDDAHRTLAEILATRGYATGAFVSAFVLDARYGLRQGFETYDDRTEAPGAGAFPSRTTERSAPAVTDAARAWISARDAGKPFFAWVHYFDPHAPYEPPPQAAARAGGKAYEGEIAAVDSELGRLLAVLDERRLRDRTVVVLVADHGESLGEHDEETHSLFVYDAVLRVPLVLSAPGIARPGVVEHRQASTVDLLPTLLDLLGVDRSAAWLDGVSLLGPDDAGRTVYFESLVPYLDYGWAPLAGLRRAGEKLIEAPRPEYFDLRADPAELRNLFGSAPAAEALRAELARRRQGWPSLQEVARGVEVPDAESAEKLSALGYIGVPSVPKAEDVALKDPKDMVSVTTAILRGNALLSEGKLSEALAAIASVPDDPSTLYLRAKVFLKLGRTRDAEAALRAVNAIRPRADTLLLEAQIQILDGRVGEAAALLDAAEELDPRHGGVHIARGDLLVVLGGLDEARQSYLAAMEVDPYRAAALAQDRISRLPAGRGPGPTSPSEK